MSDYLLGYARARRIAARVDFIYELTPSDLPALFRLARVFAYLPDADAEASVVPVVEALRAGLPMVLSDTQVNREAAGEAAAYVRPEARGEVLAALENALEDVSVAPRRCRSANAAAPNCSPNTPWPERLMRDLHVAVTPAFKPQAAGGSAGTNRLSGHFLRISNPKLLPKKVLRILAVLKDSSIFVFAK